MTPVLSSLLRFFTIAEITYDPRDVIPVGNFFNEFTIYHLEVRTATLHEHITKKIVTVIDSLLGANHKYSYLLGLHTYGKISELPEYVRRTYPWLHTANKDHWTELLEALKVLSPENGRYTLRSWEHLMVLGEECQLRFALETKVSGEDTYIN